MRVVITGGAGFLGSHLCERLLAEGHQVHCVDNFCTGRGENISALLGHAGFKLQRRDACRPLAVPGAVDAVMHFASPASPVDYARLAIPTLMAGSLGTLRALELAQAKGARFLLASTSEVYGDPLIHPQPESYWGHVNPIGPRSMYDEAKRFAEALTMAYHREAGQPPDSGHLNHTPPPGFDSRKGRPVTKPSVSMSARFGVDTRIVRIFNTYGPRMRPADGRVVSTFIRQALAAEPLTVAGDGRQTRSFCYVTDLIGGLLRLLALEGPGAHLPVNLGSTEEYSVLGVAEMIVRLTGSSSRIVHVPLPGDDPKVRRPVLDRARRLLDWNPEVDLETGLRQTIAWFRQLPQPALAGEFAVPAA